MRERTERERRERRERREIIILYCAT